jgi:hypothetical protein
MYAVILMALSLADDPLVLVALGLLICGALGAMVLMSDLLSNKHRDRLSIVAFRRLAWGVAGLAATALLLLALSL